jgi:hypothetical protein
MFGPKQNGSKIVSRIKNKSPDQKIEGTISNRSVGVPIAGSRQMGGKHLFPIKNKLEKWKLNGHS